MDLDLALKAAMQAAQECRQLLLSYFGRLSQVSEKEQAGLVSEADVKSEELCGKVLRSYFPDFGMLGEEGTESSISEKDLKLAHGIWIVDPLDGTSNYVHMFPIYCISIALQWKNELQVGVIDVPALQRTYYGSKGRGAFLRDQIIGGPDRLLRISQRQKLSESLLATGFNSYDVAGLDDQIQIFSSLVRRCRGVRRAGSAAFDLCMVAEGVFDTYWEKNLKPWDMAAGALLVREAGGIVTDYAGLDYTTPSLSIIAGSRPIHAAVLETVKKSCQKSD